MSCLICGKKGGLCAFYLKFFPGLLYFYLVFPELLGNFEHIVNWLLLFLLLHNQVFGRYVMQYRPLEENLSSCRLSCSLKANYFCHLLPVNLFCFLQLLTCPRAFSTAAVGPTDSLM